MILSWHRFTTIVVALALAFGLRFLLFRTRLGVAMRAVVDNRELAALAGARPDLVSGFSWALGLFARRDRRHPDRARDGHGGRRARCR